MSTKATPRKWQMHHDEDYGPEDIYVVCAVEGDDEEVVRAHAALIIRAVNRDHLFEQLMGACEAALKYIPGSEVRSWPPGFALKDEAMKKLKAALAAVKEIGQ